MNSAQKEEMQAKVPKCFLFEDCIHVLKIEKVESYCTPKYIIVQHPSIPIHCSTSAYGVEPQLLKDLPHTGVCPLRQHAWQGSLHGEQLSSRPVALASQQAAWDSTPARHKMAALSQGRTRSSGKGEPHSPQEEPVQAKTERSVCGLSSHI